MSTHETTDRDADAWAPCTQGELASLRSRLVTTHTRRQVGRLLGGTLATAACVAVALAAQPFSGPDRMISCRECLRLLPAYELHVAGAEEMPADQADAVRTHLDACPLCREHRERDRHSRRPATATIGSWIEALRQIRG